MNYALIYSRLVSRAQERVFAGYAERHHITPKCLGGQDDKANIVRLTPEEHYVAHQLLLKMYPDNPKLLYAATMLAMGHAGRRTNKLYGWIKRRIAEDRRQPKSDEHIAKLRGQKRTAEQRARMSAGRTGNRAPHSQETKDKIAKAHTGRIGQPCSSNAKTASIKLNTLRKQVADQLGISYHQTTKEVVLTFQRKNHGFIEF